MTTKAEKYRQQAEEDMEMLSRLWPRVFILDAAKSKQVYPLAINIHQDIYPTWKAKGINGVRLKYALRRYCNRLPYQFALANKRPRINLRGRIVADVEDAHQRVAQGRVKEILQRKALAKRSGNARSRAQSAQRPKVRVTSKVVPKPPAECQQGAKPRFRRTLTLRRTA